MNKKQHILVIRLSAMGDVAMTVPVLKTFVKQYPEVKITVLSKPFLKPLFNDIPNVSFIAAEVTSKHKGVVGIYKLYKELKPIQFTSVADLHNVLRSKILRAFFRFTNVKIASIDKGRKEKKALTRTTNKVFKQLKTTHERYADVFRNLGFNLSLSVPELLPKKALTNKILQLTGVKTCKWVGIAPFAQYQSKMYPIHLMKQVIEILTQNSDIKILLFGGGKKEIDILDGIAKEAKNIINIAGKVNLEEELAIISNLDCMLSMDSGNAHFAAMFGVNTLTIWGVTHPFTGFAPFNQPFENAILPDLQKYPNIPCSIYGNYVCEGYENIMETILPEKITNKIMASI
ncbi:glycosyltransferase family 9 protein [Lutibacter sp.]